MTTAPPHSSVLPHVLLICCDATLAAQLSGVARVTMVGSIFMGEQAVKSNQYELIVIGLVGITPNRYKRQLVYRVRRYLVQLARGFGHTGSVIVHVSRDAKASRRSNSREKFDDVLFAANARELDSIAREILKRRFLVTTSTHPWRAS